GDRRREGSSKESSISRNWVSTMEEQAVGASADLVALLCIHNEGARGDMENLLPEPLITLRHKPLSSLDAMRFAYPGAGAGAGTGAGARAGAGAWAGLGGQPRFGEVYSFSSPPTSSSGHA
ncbi:unnamed protein product, partial [Discosporangium mesarthrocarpum]